jgi:7,8-dihydropterin-6-yl-methyl-4-(beta-D-ribofuranosyl)aminobenzene 5'-phosphate synthase
MKTMIERRFFIKSLVLGAGSIMFRNFDVSSADIEKDSILVKMIFNNLGNNQNYKTSWGLAIWIEENNRALLFDTGDNPDVLWQNIRAAGIDLSKLNQIVISHNHNDHLDGLPVVLEKTKNTPVVYVPAADAVVIQERFSQARVKGITDPLKITEAIWTTGQLKGSMADNIIYEQSIVIVQGNAQFILTGCAHSGIVQIVERASQMNPDKEIKFAGGGFHLSAHTPEQVKAISDRLIELKVKKIAPSHCTGTNAIQYFRAEWKDRFVDYNIGDQFTV